MSRIYLFDTENQNEAVAALIVYSIYRCRNYDKFKVSTEMWGQIERFIKASAKRSIDLYSFIESLRPKIFCEDLRSSKVGVAVSAEPVLTEDGKLVEFTYDENRVFLGSIINHHCDQDVVLGLLLNKTTYIVMLVRERLEIEKKLGVKEDE